jgi:hypothetical protein
MSKSASHLQCLYTQFVSQRLELLHQNSQLKQNFATAIIYRQSSDALACALVNLTSSPSKASLDACPRYRRPGGRVERYFCSNCGTGTFDHEMDVDKRFASSGIVELSPDLRGDHQNVIKITSHGYVVDTGDGGLASLMSQLRQRNSEFR